VTSRSETLEVELPEDVRIEPAENAAQIDEQSAEANDMAAPDIGAVKLRTER